MWFVLRTRKHGRPLKIDEKIIFDCLKKNIKKNYNHDAVQ